LKALERTTKINAPQDYLGDFQKLLLNLKTAHIAVSR
jgi:hypothetical protein